LSRYGSTAWRDSILSPLIFDQLGDVILGDPVAEVLVVLRTAQVLE